ncbi:MAG: GNAT family N-acetyltransferase [Hyphomicrobiales bacterium]|nr:GNAT family N-acetyltransferase [Hyphomicrobiales bacterium]
MHGTIDTLLQVEWRPLSELGPFVPQWRELAGRALAPNVFYEPAFALAAAPALGGDAGALLVWSRADAGRLIGLFPTYIDRRRYGIAPSILVGWTHPYAPLGAPLVDGAWGEAAFGAWLDHIAATPELPSCVLLPYFPLDGALARALDAALARRGGRALDLAHHARALLAPAEDRGDYLTHAVGSKKRKELRRQHNRLAELGVLTTTIARDPCTIARALEDFLMLEAAGWKGRSGTAARGNTAIATFMANAVIALAAEGKAEIAVLRIDAQPIAGLVTLKSAHDAWCWKIAYDESYGRSSPGVQLMIETTQRFVADPDIESVDSCATADHPMIDHIWRERLVLADRLLCAGAEDRLRFAVVCRLETWRRGAIEAAKTLRNRLRRTTRA